MTHTVKNLSRRLVTFRGNSGQTWHIPPNTSIELPGSEVDENAKVRKLTELHLIGVVRPDIDQDEPDGDHQERAKKPKRKR